MRLKFAATFLLFSATWATGTVQVPGLGFSQNFSVAAGGDVSTIALVDLHEPGILPGLAKDGDSAAVNVLLPLVYAELRRIASGHLQRHAPNTFHATELINEAWLRLARTEQPDWQSRLPFPAHSRPPSCATF